MSYLIDKKNDVWTIPSKEDQGNYYFYFDFFSNEWIKEEIKNYTLDCLEVGKIKASSSHRYNYSLRHFFEYLEFNEIQIETFADLTPKIIEKFIHYLMVEVETSSTRAVALSALKHLLNYGEIFELEGYPKIHLFDRTAFRMLQTEDILKSMIIPDPVMQQIKSAADDLLAQKDYDLRLLGCLIIICMYTGIRISEALMLNENSITNDFFGKPLLEVISEKNETERYIVVRQEVVDTIELLKELSAENRSILGTKRLFVHYLPNAKRAEYLWQVTARSWLKKRFVRNYGISHVPGELYELTFHQFRHTLATDMLANGMSPTEIKDYLGHESLHSTRLYAKVRNSKLVQAYKKLGFIGLIVNSLEDISDQDDKKINESERLMAQLPDGLCARPIKEKVSNCKQPNACLFCPKFITTPEFLETHKDHLQRIRQDKNSYKEERFIGTDYLINETEAALLDIILRLERFVGIDGTRKQTSNGV
ncbi:tyrosine-type recombinase/integrase [Paenibacillus sp. WQ 127069]|uniref:Tyrosine-type recombinase/integrase n=1 Tax=Paenibacillus baimaensis TaxID=2982185 RepID=A0ABT2UBD8_9BACL|nr:site-specific integrase [Paenibacillus sp. WQ 127069]MCU6791902.1 tyrosine-type recombinase/integrase [Paenibacillus sp. WQ 127069]